MHHEKEKQRGNAHGGNKVELKNETEQNTIGAMMIMTEPERTQQTKNHTAKRPDKVFIGFRPIGLFQQRASARHKQNYNHGRYDKGQQHRAKGLVTSYKQ